MGLRGCERVLSCLDRPFCCLAARHERRLAPLQPAMEVQTRARAEHGECSNQMGECSSTSNTNDKMDHQDSMGKEELMHKHTCARRKGATAAARLHIC